jgi:hypothetical protein
MNDYDLRLTIFDLEKFMVELRAKRLSILEEMSTIAFIF